jgi:glycosyltransferase involved in cell wall biosynthesis/FMN phosphatase YigB (HAD superfamily)
VTVITRTKDRPLLLRRCIRSVLGQTCRDWLHVIVNDGGNPRVLHSLVMEYEKAYAGRVEVIDHPVCQGMQNASNRGLDSAAGEFVTIHDDDDSWESDFLRACIKFLDEAGAAGPIQGVITQTVRVLEELNSQSGVDELGREDYLPVKNVELFGLGSDNAFAPIAFLYRRSVHQQIGLFNEQFSVVGDWDFNLRFLARFEIGVIDQRLANYHWRHHSGGTIYANTVTEARDEHARKGAELRNHYLREDLRAGHLGLGYLINSARLLHGHSGLLWDVRNRGDQAIHEVQKVQGRLRHWEWLFTRNRRLKAPSPSRPAPPDAHTGPDGGNRGLVLARACHEALAAVLAGNSAPQVLSLDVFDTALCRVVRRPVDAFVLLAPAVRRELASDPELPFGSLRVAAERTARARKLAAAGHEEVSLAEIYDVFCELVGVKPSMHRDRLLELEMSAEATLLYPNPAVLTAALAAERVGTRVIFVSDMYLPPGFIVNQLRRAGYQVDKGSLFLSWEYGASKHTGGLFDQVLGSLGCAPDEIVHVGDNFHSDVERAQQRGIRTIHWDTLARNLPANSLALVDQMKDGAASPAFADDDFLSSLCVGLARRSARARPDKGLTGVNPAQDEPKQDALWDRLGYEVGGPLYFTFLHWLLRQARQEGRERLFFLARDGHYLRQACDLLTAAAGCRIQAVDMAASRRLLNLPQVTAFDHAAWQFLLTPNPNLQVCHFLTRLGFDPKSFAAEIRRAGFASPNEVVTTAAGVFRSEADLRAMRALFLSLETSILAQAAAERECLQRYFAQIEFIPARAATFAVIDVGWQASSARALQTLFNLRSRAAGHEHCTLRAFYFGTWQFARTALEAGCDLSSFFFHLDKPAPRRALVSEAVELIELFFGAPHPTIVGLREGADGRIEPLYGSPEHDDEHQRCITRMRERAVDFVRDVATLAPAGELLDWSGSGLSYLQAVLERLLRYPSVEEARTLGALPARDSFGGSSPSRPIAQPPGRMDRWLHPARLSQAYQHAFWKRGFLAQLSPREAIRAQVAR